MTDKFDFTIIAGSPEPDPGIFMSKGNPSNLSKLLQLLSFAKPSKRLIAILAVLSLAQVLSNLGFPILTQTFIDQFTADMPFPALPVVSLVVLLTLGSIAGGVSAYLVGTLGNEMLVNLRSKLLGKVLYLPVKFYDNTPSSEPASRIINDTSVVNNVLSQEFVPLVSSVVTLLASIVILWVIDWQLTAVLFATLLLAFAIVVPVTIKLIKLSKTIQSKEAEFLSFTVERLSLLRLVKAYTGERQCLKDSKQMLGELFDAKQKEVKVYAYMAPVAGMTIVLTLIIILGFGASRVNQGLITIGTLVGFIMYLFNIIMPLIQIINFTSVFNKSLGASQRLHELLTNNSEPEQDNSAKRITGSAIAFEQVNFAYSEDTPILKSVNFKIEQNQTVAFVGKTGSGKSTIFSLLLRFYDATSGKITIGDTEINDVNLHHLRNQFSYIAQDSLLLNGTMRENLTFGMEQPPGDEQINHAIEQAELHEFVSGLKDGLETEVGERGVKLSGGQKQRLAIARAMLNDNPILLCDEATSSLDATTEYKIQQAMEKLRDNKTVLIAAHRLSTVVDADNIIVVDEGEIVAQGTHEQLLQSQDFYRELVEHQLRAFNENAA